MLSPIRHRNIFLFGLIALVVGMLFGAVPTSLSQAILLANWLLERNYANKWKYLKDNKIFWILLSLFLLHVIGLTYTSDFGRGMEDVKTKLPLLIIPTVLFTTKPLTPKELKLLAYSFITAVIASSLYCYLVYVGVTAKDILDVRQSSVFMSHIRFSLIIAFAVFCTTYLFIREKALVIKLTLVLSVLWFLFFMYKLEMATGMFCLLTTGVILGFYHLSFRLNKALFILAIFCSMLVASYLIFQASKSLSMYNPVFSNAANIRIDKTANYRSYYHDTLSQLAENGNLILININDFELRQEWGKRSSLNFDEFDNKKNILKYTLYRYLSSKGLRKDSAGVSKLSNQDIRNIEDGNTNYKYNNNSGLNIRWRELVWEYVNYTLGENPSGHTLSMRLEFWKTGWYIAKKHLLIGVGTGDVQLEYNKAYTETNSQLTQEWRLRCHNQYLAILVAFGVVGLFLFLVYMLYPAILLAKKLHTLFWPFLFIILISYITEDTLETQAGVTFFVLYYTLFLWDALPKKYTDS